MIDRTDDRMDADDSNGPLDDLLDWVSERLRAGEALDVDACIAKHPEFETQIRKLLPAMRVLANLNESSLEPEGTEQSRRGALDAKVPEQTLGDYRLLREVGRGGMGVVYEAEQISLRRRVALKVLPFAAVMDPRHVRRFQNEALAAAQLKHPNIVSVFGVGCVRGIHFYAMEYVEGQTLAAVIEETRRTRGASMGTVTSETERPGNNPHPDAAMSSDCDSEFLLDPTIDRQGQPNEAAAPRTAADVPHDTSPVAGISTLNSASSTSPGYFRSVAEIGIQVADALYHAHEEGIIHRDIKPANLILDAGGKVSVTDFGLARIVGEPGVTMTGDMLGTLRYMSPEQVLAKQTPVDHRCDIYSLGVTLYELLTLEAAFPQQDRQQLLRRIAFEDFRPPRRVNVSIPKELETIVLTAAAKNPAERYANAKELSEDLRRFLDNRPLHAKPPTILQRLQKWSIRNRGIVGTAAVILLLLTLGLAISNIVIAWERNARVAALNESEANFQASLDAVDRFLARVGDETLRDIPHVQEVRRMLIADAIQFYEQLLQRQPDNPPAIQRLAAMHSTMGTIQRHAGELEDSDASHRRAISMLEGLVNQQEPKDDAVQYQLAQARDEYSWTLRGLNKLDDSLAQLEQGLRNMERLMEMHPNKDVFRIQLGRTHMNIAFVQQMRGKSNEATRHSSLGLQYVDKAGGHDASFAYSIQAFILLEHKSLEEAEEAARTSCQLQKDLVSKVWSRYERLTLLNRINLLARVFEARKKSQDALDCREEALEVARQLAREFPSIEYCRRQFELAADAYYGRLRATKGPETQERLKRWLERSEFPYEKGYCQALRGDIALEAKDFEEAERCYTEAIELDASQPTLWERRGQASEQIGNLEAALRDYTSAIERDASRATLWERRGRAYERVGNLDAALGDYSTAIELSPRPSTLKLRADIYMSRSEFEPALADVSRAIELSPTPAWHLFKRRGTCRFHLGNFAEALADFQVAVELKPFDGSNFFWISPELVAECPDDTFREGLLALADSALEHGESADLRHGRGGLFIAFGWEQRAMEELQRAIELDPGLRNIAAWRAVRHPTEMKTLQARALEWSQAAVAEDPQRGYKWNTLGVAHYRLGRFDEAIEALRKSLELQGDNCCDHLFLAMAYHRLGDEGESRRWYEAAQSFEERETEELRRFRAEASALFGECTH